MDSSYSVRMTGGGPGVAMQKLLHDFNGLRFGRVGPRLLLSALALYASNSFAQTIDLDAPVSRTPTVRSELKRGQVDAATCFSKDENLIPSINFTDCIEKNIKDNIGRSTISDPYLYGIYTDAIWRVDILIHHLDSSGAISRKFVPLERASWKKHLQAISARSGITPAIYCEAVAGDTSSCAKGAAN